MIPKITERIDQKRLKELLSYDAENGTLTWLKPTGRRVKPGDRVNGVDGMGYLRCMINGVSYRAHQLAWLYMTGELPGAIDHINRVPSDNRICNLRLATKAQNAQNMFRAKQNKSGHKGVSWNKQFGKWNAKIGVNNRGISLGLFDRIEDAVTAYANAASKYHTHNQEAAQCSA